jgi:O-antigen/teichoic acid export membrane protein
LIRSVLLILSGNAFAALLLLARNLIIARLIPVADYGIASTFAVAMAVVEMMSALGLQQQIVQAKEGDVPRFQAALQGFQVLRGVISGLVLFVIAAPLARFLGIPEANALVHFDIHRLNRDMVFGPMILTGIIPALASVLSVWPLSHWFGDWRVMLYALMLHAVLTTLTSHIVAQRPYHLVFERKIMTESLRFGWPLLVNGILMFLVFNGDKLIVGNALGMETLAVFAMGVTLTLTPTLVLAKSAQNFFLPRLSRLSHGTAHEDGENFSSLAQTTIAVNLLSGLLLVFGVVVAGGPFIDLLLGTKYAALIPLLTLLAVMQALRVFKAGGAIVALAREQTSNAMVANLFRVASLPLAWWTLQQGGTVVHLIWIGIAGELCGFVASLMMLRGRVGISLKPLTIQLTLTAVFLIVALAEGPLQKTGISTAGRAFLLGLILIGFLGSMTPLRKTLFRYFKM